jgi:hypothetical protein
LSDANAVNVKNANEINAFRSSDFWRSVPNKNFGTTIVPAAWHDWHNFEDELN